MGDLADVRKMNLGPVLQKIVESKFEDLPATRAKIPLEILRLYITRHPTTPKDFKSALVKTNKVQLIAEIKKASPSVGLIREDFDPVAIAQSYAQGGAAAISVLTDEKFFQGSLDYLKQVRKAVDLPILRKDFIVSIYQVTEARYAGADTILLIASILKDETLVELHALAESLGMSVLVETHSEEDIRRVLRLITPSILGINNRDLSAPDLNTDLGHTARMIPVIKDALGNRPMPIIVAESGIRTPDDVRQMRDLGVSAVLVGESLMRQKDPGVASKELMSI